MTNAIGKNATKDRYGNTSRCGGSFFFVRKLRYPEGVISSALVGYIAGTLTTASFLPQVWHSFRSRSCRDLSYVMLFVMGSGTALWTVYGFMLRRLPIILPNAISVCLIGSLIVMKSLYHPRRSSK